jgi:hypothetical protein
MTNGFFAGFKKGFERPPQEKKPQLTKFEKGELLAKKLKAGVANFAERTKVAAQQTAQQSKKGTTQNYFDVQNKMYKQWYGK